MEETGMVIVKEEMVLEKFDGDGEDAVLRERILLIDQQLVRHEFFDKRGKLTKTVEGGN